MANLLYVTCDLKSVEHSCGLSIGRAFLDEYLRFNPRDKVHFLDLYRDNIQRIDIDVLNGLEKMRDGIPFNFLNEDEMRKIDRIWRSADQFMAADKYLFITPMFNLGFPAELKMYVDTICVAGKTYIHTPAGPVGLLKNQGRKCLHIHTSEGFHYGKKEDHSVPYLKSIMGFMGIDDFEAIVVEGVDGKQKLVEQVKRSALEKALHVAGRF
jgi:FMN-dependent NADH-azoreductase